MTIAEAKNLQLVLQPLLEQKEGSAKNKDLIKELNEFYPEFAWKLVFMTIKLSDESKISGYIVDMEVK